MSVQPRLLNHSLTESKIIKALRLTQDARFALSSIGASERKQTGVGDPIVALNRIEGELMSIWKEWFEEE